MQSMMEASGRQKIIKDKLGKKIMLRLPDGVKSPETPVNLVMLKTFLYLPRTRKHEGIQGKNR